MLGLGHVKDARHVLADRGLPDTRHDTKVDSHGNCMILRRAPRKLEISAANAA